MTETVVRVSTIEEWRAVLDVWFEQGYEWCTRNKGYLEYNFEKELPMFLILEDTISCTSMLNHNSIEYSEFMAQQKEDNKMETYYVTRDQYDLIEDLKNESINRLDYLLASTNKAYKTFNHLHVKESNAILRDLGGDETIEFKAKEQLYRLWAIDQYGDKVYFKQSHGFWTSPATQVQGVIFTAPLEEIEKWKTPSWNVEEAK